MGGVRREKRRNLIHNRELKKINSNKIELDQSYVCFKGFRFLYSAVVFVLNCPSLHTRYFCRNTPSYTHFLPVITIDLGKVRPVGPLIG